MQNTEIVELKPHEWQLYRDLRLRALKEEPHAFGSTYADNQKRPDSFWADRIQDASSHKAQWLVFAKVAGEIVGMAGAFAEKEIDNAHVISVYVTPESRGQGISKLLMQELLIKIKKNPLVKKITVDVNPDQLAAYNLYKNSGFEVIKKYRLTLGDGIEHDVIQLQMSV